MPPKKRRGSGDGVEHRGRVTLHHGPNAVLPTAERNLAERVRAAEVKADAPLASSRYTPPRRSVRFRPAWHKTIGVILLIVGLGVAVLNEAVRFGAPEMLLPGGHSILYLFVGLGIAACSMWWFGWFDREE